MYKDTSPSHYPNGFNNGLVVRGVPVDIPHPGKVFWVNNSTVLPPRGSSGSNGNDGSYLRPFQTLDYAIGQCTANRGDVIYVMPGYTQTMSAADAVDVDVAGVTIIGLGNGSLKPTFTYDNAAGEFVIGASNVTIANLRFIPSVTAITHAIDVEAASAYVSIIGCEFGPPDATGTDEFNTSVVVNTTCTDFLFENNWISMGLGGAAYGVSLATPTRAKLYNNVIMGDYSTACVGTITGAGVMCEMVGNILINGEPGALGTVAVFTQSAAGTWFVANNRVACDVATFLLMFTNYTSTVNLGNLYTDDTTMAATAVDRSATLVVSADA